MKELSALTVDLPVKATSAAESPSVTALHFQKDGTALVGLSFCHPLLFKAHLSADSKSVDRFEDLKLEDLVGNDALAVVQGLRSNTGGDTAFSVLHPGSLPSFLAKGADKLSASKLLQFLSESDGGFGAGVRHSVVQIVGRELRLRHHKNPGALLDVAHIGDFVFGLTGSSIWREPYLNAEKRETLRSDLHANFALHKEVEGHFWLLDAGGRFLRLGQTDIKAKPTPLKLSDVDEFFPFRVSVPSGVDGWVYLAGPQNKVHRLRMNPVSREEERQEVATLSGQLNAMICIPSGEGESYLERLIVAYEGGSHLCLSEAILKPLEDNELMGDPPVFEELGKVSAVRSISNFTRARDGALWAGESWLGSGRQDKAPPKLLRLEV